MSMIAANKWIKLTIAEFRATTADWDNKQREYAAQADYDRAKQGEYPWRVLELNGPDVFGSVPFDDFCINVS